MVKKSVQHSGLIVLNFIELASNRNTDMTPSCERRADVSRALVGRSQLRIALRLYVRMFAARKNDIGYPIAKIASIIVLFDATSLPITDLQAFYLQFLSLQERVEDTMAAARRKRMRQPSGGRFFSRPRRKRFGARVTLAFTWRALTALLLSTMPARTSAKIEVDGQLDALRLMTEDASIGEVLAALSAKFNLTYSSEPELDRTVAGTYSGTLQHVMGRILEGYDYVINVSVERIELKVLSRSAAVAKPSTLSPPGQAATATAVPIAPAAFNPQPTAAPTKYR
jgi:hypothetical protein